MLAAGQTANLQYSCEDEEQADRLSFGWMVAMRRNPDSMRAMLQTLRRVVRYSMNNVPQYLLTHPDPESRIGYVESLIELNRTKKPAPVWQQTDDFDSSAVVFCGCTASVRARGAGWRNSG